MPKNYKNLYTHFLKAHEGKLHFAAHSHHFWPDVTRSAQLSYWDDSARLSDQKWDFFFADAVPRAQKHIAKILHLKNPEQIVFAPNTHELVSRLLSLFLEKKKLNILTTDSEFHSFSRQISRLEEMPEVEVDRVEVLSSLPQEEQISKVFLKEQFLSNLVEKLQNSPPYDLVFVSQVFYDSGFTLSTEDLLRLANASSALMVVDGYHGFCALPTDLSSLEGRLFYLGGGYKYAQAGEGACFMVVPEGHWRPAYTGWFAQFGALAGVDNKEVSYASNGFSFFGATQDFSGLYRFNAVWDLFESLSLDVLAIHHFIRGLQLYFHENITPLLKDKFQLSPLFSLEHDLHGHFLTYIPQEKNAGLIETLLKENHIIIDRRGERLRFGFGLYHDKSDVDQMSSFLQQI